MIKEETNFSKASANTTPAIMKQAVKAYHFDGKYNWEKQTTEGICAWGTTRFTSVPTGNSSYGNDSDSFTD